eukprot:8596924-Pyramimonas_sp.AAC.1
MLAVFAFPLATGGLAALAPPLAVGCLAAGLRVGVVCLLLVYVRGRGRLNGLLLGLARFGGGISMR